MTGAGDDDYGDAGRPGYGGGGGGHRGGKLSAGFGTTPSDYANGGEDYGAGEGKVTGGGDTATQELPSPNHHGGDNGNGGAEQLKYPSY